MKSILLCISMLLIGIAARAQSNTASLNITLTDVQSVTFSSTALIDITPDSKEISQNGAHKVLSRSTSQIKKISSANSEYERLFKEFYAGRVTNGLAVNTSSTKRSKTSNTSNLVIFQIDPR